VSFVPVAKVGDIPEGQVRIAWVEGHPVAVFNVGGAFYVMDDVCSHDGGPVAEGPLEGFEIECPRHGARFDIRSGKPLSLPATAPVAVHRVRVVGDAVEVALGVGDSSAVGSGDEGGVSSGSASESPSPVSPDETPRNENENPNTQNPNGSATASPSDGVAPSQQEIAVRSALEGVMDPEIGLSVIDLGLIRELHFFPDRTLVRMMLTTPFCPYAPQMMEDVKNATMGVIALPTEVEIMPDAWSPQLMPDPSLLGFSY